MPWLSHCKSTLRYQLGGLAVAVLVAAVPFVASAADAVVPAPPPVVLNSDTPAASADESDLLLLPDGAIDGAEMALDPADVPAEGSGADTATGAASGDELNSSPTGGGDCPHRRRALLPTS